MDNTVKGLAARHGRIRAKQKALYVKAKQIESELNEAFADTPIYGCSVDVTLEQTGPDDYTYGRLSYASGTGLMGIYRTTGDDQHDEYNGTPEEDRGYTPKALSLCRETWLARLLDEQTVRSLLANIDTRLDERERQVDRSLAALQALLDTESAKLGEHMIASLEQIGNDTLLRNWRDARDATHLQPADGLTRSSSYVESVCAAILRERGADLPKDKSMSPLVDACIRSLQWPTGTHTLNDVKLLTNGLKSICGGIGALRTHFGTAHGATSHLPGLNASYATFANNAAAAVAIFLLARHAESADAASVGDDVGETEL
jgi:hypothetical protein